MQAKASNCQIGAIATLTLAWNYFLASQLLTLLKCSIFPIPMHTKHQLNIISSMINSYIVMAGTTKIRTIQFNSNNHIKHCMKISIHENNLLYSITHKMSHWKQGHIHAHTHHRPGNYSDHTHTLSNLGLQSLKELD